MRLSELTRGRDNNYNLIRMAAAMAVLFSHSFALATGLGSAEPMRLRLGLSWGDAAVDIFFITSGFLVTASLLSRRRAIGFVWARGLRIFPALWAMLLLTTFGIGAHFTSEPLWSYCTNWLTWHYLVKNAIPFDGIQLYLPGVFISNPWPRAVNESLWTMPYELAMYGSLLTVWLLARAARTYRLTAFNTAVISIAVAAGAIYLFDGFYFDHENTWPRLSFMFFSGAALYVLRDRTRLSRIAFWSFAIALALSAFSRTAFFFAFNATLAYLVINAAYAFEGRIRAYNSVGDYSYGVYIYSFPVQQSLASAFPGISVFSLMGSSAALTLALAVASWHFFERRALAAKDSCAEATSYWIHRLSASWKGQLY